MTASRWFAVIFCQCSPCYVVNVRRLSITTLSLAALLLSGCSGLTGADAQACPAPPEPDPNTIMDVAPASLEDTLYPDSLQLSQDGTQLAAMHGNQILIWDAAEGGSPSHSIGEATHPTGSGPLAATPDFSQFALRSADHAVTVVSHDGEEQVIELEQWHDNEEVTQVEISPDSQQLAVRGTSGIIAVFSIADHELEMTLPACGDPGGEMSFSPDSLKLFAASRHDATTIWDLETQETVMELQSDEVHYTHGAWSHDGSRLAMSARAFRQGPDDHWNLTLVDTEEWEMIRTYPELSPTQTAFFPDDEELLVANSSTSIRRWEIGAIPVELSTGVANGQATLSDDGSTAYLAGRDTLMSFDLESGETDVTYDIPEFACAEIARPEIFAECSSES